MLNWLKAVHILGAIAWIAPLVGGWWMLARIDRRDDPDLSAWARRAFLPLVHIEHLGLLLWLGSGIAMVVRAPGFLSGGWFHAKLGLVVFVILPIELWDMMVSHGRLPAALKRGDAAEIAAVLDAHRRLCRVSAALLIPATIVIVLLAAAKPF